MTTRKILIAALCVVMVATNAFGGSALYTSVWNSEAKLCSHGSSADKDLPWREVTWVNPGPGTVYIRGFSVFVGVDYGKVVDLGSHFGSLKTWNLFGDVAYERYGNTTTPNTLTRMFAPDYIEIPPGHDITLQWYCANWLWQEQGEVSAQYIYWVYWTDEKPR